MRVPATSHLPGQNESVVIRNATPHTLIHVYISPESDRNWGADKLGSDVILRGAARRFRLPDTQVAYFDIRAEDSEGKTYTFMRFEGIGNPTTRALISSLQPPSKPAFCLRRHDHWADHWASPGPDAALTRPFGATGSATSTARPTARSRRRPVCPLTNRCVDRARHRVLPGLTRPSPGRLGPLTCA